jgi:DNA (cytosine-5)-methyltransferase 3A
MKVLSLFDGISCGQIAFERNGIKFDSVERERERERERESNLYFASEIKPTAIKVTQQHYPNTIQVGDVTRLHYENNTLYKNCDRGDNDTWVLGESVYKGSFDILIGGSPCQDFSLSNIYNKQYGLDGMKSKLFYEYLRLKGEINPTYFLLENVKMKKSSEQTLNDYMGVEGIHINSNLVSFQNRLRIYWTNIPNVSQPKDKHIDFQNYIDTDVARLEESKTNRTLSRERMWNNGNGRNCQQNCDNITNKHKIHTLTCKQDRCPNSGLISYKDFCRFLTRREIEQAQTLPLGYTDSLSYNQMQDVCGDGWTVDVIAHILSFIK